MLVTLTEILKMAEEKKCAVGAFNTPNLECVNAVLSAAEKLGVPVILSHAGGHEGVSPLTVIGPVMVQAPGRSRACRSFFLTGVSPGSGTGGAGRKKAKKVKKLYNLSGGRAVWVSEEGKPSLQISDGG